MFYGETFKKHTGIEVREEDLPLSRKEIHYSVNLYGLKRVHPLFVSEKSIIDINRALTCDPMHDFLCKVNLLSI